MEINEKILEFPGKSYFFFINNYVNLNQIERLTLFKQIIKSDYYSFLIMYEKLYKNEQNLLIEKIINNEKYLLGRNIIKHQSLDKEQISKIESLFILGKLLNEYMEEDLRYEEKI